MSAQMGNPLPDHATVLVTEDRRLNLGHRPTGDGVACGSSERLIRATARQARHWSALPCPKCWRGRPW